ncbi:DUF4198 domain-containing protein [Flavihumibacter fluvii]|uniref:DUF4198 domain-containing protein n=1 Tax=Flavihumibacter fluvii TaxID=2838157 RepID=UPI001BDDD5F8|nr:DUF4198 domain-containing protein [Flavihumibacter fluvii]ULQ50835.1 DUF4198 domain-containing protein [Flavihumibacter fluvii]
MRKFVMVFATLLLSLVMAAHEFWIQPDRYLYEAGQTIYLRFWVGENFEGKNWSGNGLSVARIQIRQNKLSDDLTGNIGELPGDSLELSLHDEGTAMITMQTNNKLISLDAFKFREYLVEEGLQNAIEYRENNHENDSSGHELYQRSVKTIIQVGDELSSCCLKETGLPLDIIPLKNPYDPALRDSLKLLVKFKREAIKGQLMKVWHRVGNQTRKFEIRTSDKGIISIPLEKSGKWMISTVNMIRIEDSSAQWQSYWASCNWGYYR